MDTIKTKAKAMVRAGISFSNGEQKPLSGGFCFLGMLHKPNF